MGTSALQTDPLRDNCRVLFVNTRDQLGADVAVHLLLAQHLAGAGVSVTFTVNRQATGATAMHGRLRSMPNVEVVEYDLGSSAQGHTLGARLLAPIRSAALLWGFLCLVKLILRRRIGILHATDRPRDALFCVLLGRLTGRPSVIHLHNNYGPWMNNVSRWALAHCSCVVGISQHTSQTVRDVGIPPERIVTVLNAVDCDYFNPEKVAVGMARERWNIPACAPLVGLIGRLVPYKGHEDLLEAIAHEPGFSNVHVLIVGDDRAGSSGYANLLRTRAAALALGDRIHFTGLQDVRAIYADLDILAVPSWEEPFGLVVTEAMAMRVPVVAYRCGGIPEIIRTGVDGLLVTPRATSELADALRKLIRDPALRARFGEAGRQHAIAQFSPARQAAEMAAMYQHLLSHGKGAIPDAASGTY